MIFRIRRLNILAQPDMLRHPAESGAQRDSRNEIRSRSERLHLVLDVRVQTIDDRGDGDDAGDADDDAENGQGRSNFVRPQRIERDQQVLSGFSALSWSIQPSARQRDPDSTRASPDRYRRTVR